MTVNGVLAELSSLGAVGKSSLPEPVRQVSTSAPAVDRQIERDLLPLFERALDALERIGAAQSDLLGVFTELKCALRPETSAASATERAPDPFDAPEHEPTATVLHGGAEFSNGASISPSLEVNDDEEVHEESGGG